MVTFFFLVLLQFFCLFLHVLIFFHELHSITRGLESPLCEQCAWHGQITGPLYGDIRGSFRLALFPLSVLD